MIRGKCVMTMVPFTPPPVLDGQDDMENQTKPGARQDQRFTLAAALVGNWRANGSMATTRTTVLTFGCVCGPHPHSTPTSTVPGR